MFERFTAKSRRALVEARTEARALRASAIAPEHLLLGVMVDPQSVGGRILAEAGLTADRVRGALAGDAEADPARHQPADPPFTQGAKQVLEMSLKEALKLGHNYIGTEHILIALSRHGGLVAELLAERGLDAAGTVQAVTAVLVEMRQRAQFLEFPGAAEVSGRAGRLGRRAMRGRQRQAMSGALNSALDRMRPGEGDTATSADLVAALLEDSRARATLALAALGVTPQSFRQAVEAVELTRTSDSPLPTTVEVKLGDTRSVIDDPELAAALTQASPEQIRAALRRLLDDDDPDEEGPAVQA
ncbi:MAG TPA: Clp protease N-terminal domain-containing protein [Acidimicrobiales bacterium]|nr:Clp protease N-terminal domain-containing protein [Acidimicrobiales bacterium]